MLRIIHRPVLYFKLYVPETEFYVLLQVELTIYWSRLNNNLLTDA
jgi:hypothetical protein